MGKISVETCHIEGLKVITPQVFGDARGYFMETYNYNDYKEAGIDQVFVQDNQSASKKGVLRGLHFQRPPHAQSKLVRCVRGAVLDVAVDIRRGSPTYGRHVAVELTEDNHLQLFIPRGFAHGFAVLSAEAVFQYKCDDYYAPEAEDGIAWDDPSLGIDWRIPEEKIILSEKDRRRPRLSDAEGVFEYGADVCLR